jgi:phosphoglycolate phosphatase
VTQPPAIELVCLDVAGTTVVDGGMVEEAFDRALDRVGLSRRDGQRDRMLEHVRATMGTAKIEVFRSLLGAEYRARAANAAFEDAYEDLVRAGGLEPVPGALAAIDAVRRRGIPVVLTTGFSVPTRELVIASLGWERLIDLALSPADAGRGRPHPDMIVTAAARFAVADPQAVAVAGDTAADMASGQAARAGWVVGVLSGAGRVDQLRAAGATHVIESVAGLPGLFWRE